MKKDELYFEVKRHETWNGEMPLSVYATKLGGVPYLPKDMEYPCVLEGEYAGEPLDLLAQINFEELPKVEGFPETGILQFYVGGDDKGQDSGHPFNQNCFRVIYHETICKDESKLYAEEDLPNLPAHTGDYSDNLPFSGEYELLCGKNDGDTCIGGYPCFAQQDPREYGDAEYEACDVLLFQLASEGGVMWGDEGVGNFFISSENLKKKDFSQVLYHWDCY